MRILAGDIGGTKTLLAIYSGEGKKWTLEREQRYISRDYPNLEEIITAFLQEGKGDVSAACFGIAGPIKEGVAKATNLPWVVNAKNIQKQFKIPNTYLINDLKANAYGIQTLSEKDFYVLNEGKEIEGENRALVSAGTGLGEAPIIFHSGELIPTASEGGHADFAPRDDLEIALLKSLQSKFGHVSTERVLSGLGLENLYRFIIGEGIEKPLAEVKDAMQRENPGHVITDFALKGKCRACGRTVKWFSSLYGAEAGNFALKVMAVGGVYIGGGIAPKILPFLKEGDFLAAFKNKGRFAELLEEIPIRVILDENTALKGAAFFCEKMEKGSKN